MTRKSKPKNTKAGASQLRKTIPEQNKSAENNEIRNTDNLTKKIRPPPIPYDPNAIFGGDSDEDPYDYSDDEVVDNTRPPPWRMATKQTPPLNPFHRTRHPAGCRIPIKTPSMTTTGGGK